MTKAETAKPAAEALTAETQASEALTAETQAPEAPVAEAPAPDTRTRAQMLTMGQKEV